MMSVCVSWSCRYKLPPTGRLTTTETHSLTVEEVRIQNHGVGRTVLPLRGLREKLQSVWAAITEYHAGVSKSMFTVLSA